MRTRLFITAVIIAVGAGGGLIWFNEAVSPVNRGSDESYVFVVKKGEAIRQISDRLQKENLIRSPLAFYLTVRMEGLSKDIQAGDFRLSPAMNAKEIAEGLTHGTLDVWITIPEGWRNGQISSLLKTEVGINEEEFLGLAKEGYMFPDTYLIPKGASAQGVISIFENNFANKTNEELKNEISKSSLSIEKIVILASIIEREARIAKDRPLMAGVLINRLNLGMPLQADATLQFINGYSESTGKWWTPALSSDKELNSPYNTYKNTGLPPAPISNPGIAALKAAANPAKTDYLYYISEPDGTSHYAETLEEHNVNIDKYLR